MKLFLFPRTLALYGIIITIVSTTLGICDLYFKLRFSLLGDFSDEVASIGIIIGLLFMGFSRQKTEDEMIQFLRLKSLHFSLFVNYALLLASIVLFYDFVFFHVMVYNMFTFLIVYNAKFYWSLKRI